MTSQLRIVDWGRLAFDVAHRRQLTALDDRLRGRIDDTVFLVEHPHVYTCGRGVNPQPSQRVIPVEDTAVPWVPVERGGEITYHGPGQLVAYPIVDVKALTGDLHRYLHWLEDVVIRTIAPWGIDGRHDDTHTGVWVGERKIASIGIAVKKWVSYHGLALNVSTDLRYFGTIHPCGLPPEVMTSMEQLTGEAIALDDVKRVFSRFLRS